MIQTGEDQRLILAIFFFGHHARCGAHHSFDSTQTGADGSMSKRMIAALAVFLLSLPAALAQVKSDRQEAPAFDRKPVNAVNSVNPFIVGERLNYEASWSSFLVAGELTLETRERASFDGTDAFRITALAQSVGLVSLLGYKVKDVYESFISVETLKPFRAEKRIRHKNRSEESSVRLDHERGVAHMDNGKTLEIPSDTYDLAGLIYAIRAMDLTEGKARRFTLIEDDKLYPLLVEPGKKEKLELKSGKYDVVLITTKAIGKRNEDPYKLRIYITNDSRRLPVLITASPAWGEVRVELTSFSGTRK